MIKGNFMKQAMLTTTVAAVLAASVTIAPSALAQGVTTSRPANDVTLSVGTGRMVRLNGEMSDLFVANDAIADVQVRSTNQIYIFGKAPGETTVYATTKGGKVIYSANVRVGTNIGSVDQFLSVTMPEANLKATPMNGMVLLTGTVAAPADIEEAQRIVQAFVGEDTQVISRIKTATPQQVMLQVKIAEVSRSLMKDIGVNFQASSRLGSGGFVFGRGRNFFEVDEETGLFKNFVRDEGSNALNLFGNVLGVDILSAIDLNESNGLVTTLAEPTLVALSGETASFLAGGEFPIATTSGLNGTEIEFKEYGVSLAFTPTVLDGGRISMRVRPEVSELTSQGAIRLGNIEIPGLTTRRAETTVELGSGQSFMIGGLLQNNGNNSVEKVPGLGDLPIIGALFRSTGFRKNETELVIMVTPYLVKPVSAAQIALPTDGFRTATDPQRILLDQKHQGRSGDQRPNPVAAQPQVVPALPPRADAVRSSNAGQAASANVSNRTDAPPTPGFSF